MYFKGNENPINPLPTLLHMPPGGDRPRSHRHTSYSARDIPEASVDCGYARAIQWQRIHFANQRSPRTKTPLRFILITESNPLINRVFDTYCCSLSLKLGSPESKHAIMHQSPKQFTSSLHMYHIHYRPLPPGHFHSATRHFLDYH